MKQCILVGKQDSGRWTVQCPECKKFRTVTTGQKNYLLQIGNSICKPCGCKRFAIESGNKIATNEDCIIINAAHRKRPGYKFYNCLVECPQCHKQFEKGRQEIKINNHTICRSCKTTKNRKNIPQTKECIILEQFTTAYRATVQCPQCQKIFTKQRGEITRSKHTFCRNCAYAEARNYRWKGGKERYYGPKWKQITQQIQERDGYKCKRCGAIPKVNRKFDVHHIISFSDFSSLNDANQFSNLIYLCPRCHRRADANLIPSSELKLLIASTSST